MKSLFTLIFATLLITASYSQFQAGIHFPGKEIQEFTIYRTTVAGAWIIDSSYHDVDELEKRYYSNRNNHGRYLNAETIQYNADSNTWEEVERRSFDYHFDTVLKEIIIEEYYKSISEWRIITHNQYNEAGDITHYEWITRDSQGDISQGFLYTYEYNQAGYNIYELSRLYDPEQEQWINSLEVYYEYDENGNNTIATYYLWNNESQEWENYIKYLRYYENNNLVERIIQQWDNNIMEWTNNKKELRYYNDLIKLDSIVEYSWNSGEWEKLKKDFYFYSASGLLATLLKTEWSDDSAAWINDRKNTYEYDGYDQEIISISQRWENSNWRLLYRRLTEYFDVGYIASIINQNHNGTDWVNFSKQQYLYDEHYNKVEQNGFQWDYENGWDTTGHERFFWGFFQYTNMEENRISQFSIYPNPARDILHLKVNKKITNKTFHIFSLEGRMIKSITLADQTNTIDINGLKPGCYFLIAEGSATRFIVQ